MRRVVEAPLLSAAASGVDFQEKSPEADGIPIPSPAVIDFFLAMDDYCEGGSPLDAKGSLLNHILVSMIVADEMTQALHAAIKKKNLPIQINPKLTVEFAAVRQIPKMLALLASKGQAFVEANRFMVEGDGGGDPDFAPLPLRPVDATDLTLWIAKIMELSPEMIHLLDLVRKRRAGLYAKKSKPDLDLSTPQGWYTAIYEWGFREEDGTVNWDEMIGNIASAVVNDEVVCDIRERYADLERRSVGERAEYGLSALEVEAYGNFEAEHLDEFCRLCDIPDFYSWLKKRLASRAQMDPKDFQDASTNLIADTLGGDKKGFTFFSPLFTLIFRMNEYMRRCNNAGEDTVVCLNWHQVEVSREGIRQNLITLLESARSLPVQQ